MDSEVRFSGGSPGFTPTESASQKTASINQNQPKETSFSAKILKTALPSVVLDIIWGGSSHLKSVPLINKAVNRETYHNHPHIPEKIQNLIVEDTSIKKDNSNHSTDETTDRFKNYSVYPPFPNQPTPLSKRHLDLLKDPKELTKLLIDNGLQSQLKVVDLENMGEILKHENKPLSEKIKDFDLQKLGKLKDIVLQKSYKDLPPGARQLYQAMNLALIKEHLSDINDLANSNIQDKSLEPYGLNYFELEIADTLSRGLAFIDKDVLKDQTIKIPVKVGDKFELKEYKIERFNISDSNKRDENGELVKKYREVSEGVYVEDKDGSFVKDEKGNYSNYHDQGHPVFFLTPNDENDKTAPPILVARGTLLAEADDDGAFASVQADTREGISMKWLAGNEPFRNKLQDVVDKHGLIDVVGHSLGAHQGLSTAIIYHQAVNRTTVISPVYINKTMYKHLNNTNPLNRAILISVPVKGDLVPGAGSKIPGVAIQAAPVTTKTNNATEQHLVTFNNNGIVSYSAVNNKKENSKVTRWFNTAVIIKLGALIKGKPTALVKKLAKDFIYADITLAPREPQSSEVKKILGGDNGLFVPQDIEPVNGKFSLSQFERAQPGQILNFIKNHGDDFEKLFLEDRGVNVQKLSPQAAAKFLIALERSEIGKKKIQDFVNNTSVGQKQFIYLLNESENSFKLDKGKSIEDVFSFPSLRPDSENKNFQLVLPRINDIS